MMHSYRVRPGYGSDKLLIEFGPSFGDAQFFADLKTVFLQQGFRPGKSGHYVVGEFTVFDSPAGPFQLEDDGGAGFIVADKNQAAIHYLDQIFQSSGLFMKEEVNYSKYAHQTPSTRSSSWLVLSVQHFNVHHKRLIGLLLVAVLLGGVAVIRITNSQAGHLYQVKKHIARITPQWEAFKRANHGFERVRLFPFTGGGGMFGASGQLFSDADFMKLQTFLESTKPPRPVWMGIRVFPLNENSVNLTEPTGTVNRSLPVLLWTNSTPLPAGSER
jgi:hypothetical protein